MIKFFFRKNIFKIFRSYKNIKSKNNLSELTELRLFIEKNLIVKNEDYFYNFFLKKILFKDYCEIFKSHLILHTLNLNFNRQFYKGYSEKIINFPLPKIINKLINKYGFKTSKLNSILWKLSLLKRLFNNIIYIIRLIRFKQTGGSVENFIYIYKKSDSKEHDYSFKSGTYSNNYSWLANKFKCKTILIPNIKDKSNYDLKKFNIFQSNNFQFNKFYKLIFFFLIFLFKFILAFFLIFTKYWHYAFMFKEIIENDSFNINLKNFNGKFFFDNNSAFDRPLWTISNLIKKNNVYLYFVSSNFEFIKLTDKCDIAHTGYFSMFWDNILVWDDRQKNILKKYIKNPELKNIYTVGPIPYLSRNNVNNKLINKKKNNLILFDVQPYRFSRYLEIGWPNEYYLFENIKKFYCNILENVNFDNTEVFYKRKREANKIDKKYLNFLKNLKIQNKITEISFDQNIFEIFENNKNIKVISMPFTGPSYVANHFDVKSSFYDPTGVIKNENYENLNVIKNKHDLDKFIND